MASRTVKTLTCVAVAGALFITSVYYGVKWLFIIAAFFDWLPLPAKWMSVRPGRSGAAGAVHGAVTAVAYALGIAWLIITRVDSLNLSYAFLVTWFIAVILGAYASIKSVAEDVP